ncbi:MAG: hypothetical protein ACOCRK_07235 [bacterium]
MKIEIGWIVTVVLLLVLLTSSVNAMDYREFAIERFKKINYDWVQAKDNLSKNDLATDKQAENRIDSIIYWSRKFNHMYPDIPFQRVVKDAIEIMLFESRGVNYWSYYDYETNKRSGELDNGNSFGIWSMQWKNAYWIANKNDWNLHNREDEIKLMKDTHKQTKYAIWFIYWLYQYMDQKANKNISINQIRHAVISGYNLPSINPNKERNRKYFFVVLGRIAYSESLIKEKVNKIYNWYENQYAIIKRIKRIV